MKFPNNVGGKPNWPSLVTKGIFQDQDSPDQVVDQ